MYTAYVHIIICTDYYMKIVKDLNIVHMVFQFLGENSEKITTLLYEI